MLDTARFTNFVAEKLGVPVGSVETLTLGSHGETMVPVQVVALSVVFHSPINFPQARSLNWSLAPVMVALKLSHFSRLVPPTMPHLQRRLRMAKAVIEDSGAVMPVCAWVDGEYGISGVYLGVEARIGRTGAIRVVGVDLSADELAEL